MKVLVNGNIFGYVKNISNNINECDNVSFLDAVNISLKQIDDLICNSPSNKDYLEIQKLLINDPVFKDEVLDLINNGNSTYSSVSFVLDKYIKSIEDSNNSYLNERSLDIKDIKNRILNNISSTNEILLDSKCIVVVDELHPSFLIKNKDNILGVIARSGGSTSHSVILCRSYGICYVVSDVLLNDNDLVLISDDIYINPSLDVVNTFKKEEVFSKLVEHNGFNFYLNVCDNSLINDVFDLGFDGIGLYRTEFIFSNSLFSVEKQCVIYSEALNKVSPIIFRTFDVGDDKQIPGVVTFGKGVINYKANIDVFKAQIEAFKSAGVKYVMFPMIRFKEEFEWLLEVVGDCFSCGIMLETKDALDNLNDFKDVSFISVGTNDLVSELYGIDRLKQLDDLSYLDDLILRLSKVVIFCNEYGIKLSICGEIAGIEAVIYKLMEIGFTNFSVNVNAVNDLNNAYRKFMNK